MDADLPYPLQPIPPASAEALAPVPAPPREPVWSGPELVIIVLVTVAAIVAATLAAGLVWAAVHYARGGAVVTVAQSLVALTLLGQTAGLALGFAIAWLWIAQQPGARFWGAIHWRPLRARQVVAMLAGGAATMVGVQVLGHFLPIPPDLPMDRLFTPQTAWMLMLYGVVAAPFFEEFFFRGLLYPSLRATFAAGMTAEELGRWGVIARAAGALGALALAVWRWRERLLALPTGAGAEAAWTAALLFCLWLVIGPRLPLAAAGWVVNRLSGWRRPELLAILVTGFCFGMLHAAQLGWAWAAVLILVLVGIALTAVRAVTGSLVASWLFHAAYNGTLFGVQFVATRGFRHFPPGLH